MPNQLCYHVYMETQNATTQIPEAAFEQLAAETSPLDAANVCAEYIRAREQRDAAEARLKALKPLVDELRPLDPSQPDGKAKETEILGYFNGNKKGRFRIVHVAKVGESAQRSASVSAMDELLAEGLITQIMYDRVVSSTDVHYNLVNFKVGDGLPSKKKKGA